jgi:hypothetical protein
MIWRTVRSCSPRSLCVTRSTRRPRASSSSTARPVGSSHDERQEPERGQREPGFGGDARLQVLVELRGRPQAEREHERGHRHQERREARDGEEGVTGDVEHQVLMAVADLARDREPAGAHDEPGRREREAIADRRAHAARAAHPSRHPPKTHSH